ncbi:MAG: HAMP domain-containing histidine kinase [Trueperaceae bacterium]|nr:HAMP domain-containing histidine kinase [Trueperaceae bacterium]
MTVQMAWWIYFFSGYVSQVSHGTLDSLQREVEALNRMLDAGDPGVIQLMATRPHFRFDGSGRVVLDDSAVSQFERDQGKVVRMLAFEGPFFVLVVMTGLFIIARSLRVERELKQRQQNFLDAIGHEYKTPLGSLRLLVETLQLRRVTPEKLQEYLGTMGSEIDRLEHTAQQVLATARLETGAPHLAMERHELGALVRELAESALPGLGSRGGEVDVVTPREQLFVTADRSLVAVLLENLLDNAVKYTPGPQKLVEVRVRRAGAAAVVEVDDRGLGIPEKELRLVFDRFYRVGNELTRTAPGIGLGLYLVKRAAESLGGTVTIAARPGGGTRASVRLPLATTEPGADRQMTEA